MRCGLEEKLSEITSLPKSLEIIINTLEELVVLNVGKEICVPDQFNIIVSVHATLPPNTNIPLVHHNKDNGFQIVRNGVKLIQNRFFLPISTYNHFQILQVDKENETQETCLVGDYHSKSIGGILWSFT